MEDDSEQILQKIMDDGTFDELRKEIVKHLKEKVQICGRAGSCQDAF
jgi:phage tail tape-measure protein